MFVIPSEILKNADNPKGTFKRILRKYSSNLKRRQERGNTKT